MSRFPPELQCTIRAEHTVDTLASLRVPFELLQDCVPNRDFTRKWVRDQIESDDLMVVAIGKTGYGKSTTLNKLLNVGVFETSDISGCTRELQSVEYRFHTHAGRYHCSFADLPGLGEKDELDEQYYPLYRKTLRQAHVVLYFVRADQRDYSVDLRAFSDLVRETDVTASVFLVLNAVDKIEPLSRALPFILGPQQRRAMEQKITSLMKIFDVAESEIIPVSGTEDFNLDFLAKKIMQGLSPYLLYSEDGEKVTWASMCIRPLD